MTEFPPHEQPGRRAPIMTTEEYAKVKHIRPYVFDIEVGDSKLSYFGMGHSNNPDDPAYQQVIETFDRVQPDFVMVEGIDRLAERKDEIDTWFQGKTKEQIIREGGESAYVLSLAAARGIEYDSPEPDKHNEVVAIAEQGFSREQIFLFYINRDVEQYYRMSERPSLEEFLQPKLDTLQKDTDWVDFEFSFDHYARLMKELLGIEVPKDWQTLHDLADPIPWPEKEMKSTNDIATASSRFRDEHIVEEIERRLKEYKRVLVVYGASHAVMQEPALRSLSS